MQRILSVFLTVFLAMTPAIASAQSAPTPSRSDSRGKAALTGALIGAGAALVITGWAAASYGENEGGKFCYPCMVQWSALSVPVGVGLGAGIGFAVGSIRQSVGPNGPRVGKQARITFTKRF